jgi:hypothetical protein
MVEKAIAGTDAMRFLADGRPRKMRDGYHMAYAYVPE